MTPLEELEAAMLNRNQEQHFIGALSYYLDSRGVTNRAVWTEAIKQAKGSKP